MPSRCVRRLWQQAASPQNSTDCPHVSYKTPSMFHAKTRHRNSGIPILCANSPKFLLLALQLCTLPRLYGTVRWRAQSFPVYEELDRARLRLGENCRVRVEKARERALRRGSKLPHARHASLGSGTSSLPHDDSRQPRRVKSMRTRTSIFALS